MRRTMARELPEATPEKAGEQSAVRNQKNRRGDGGGCQEKKLGKNFSLHSVAHLGFSREKKVSQERRGVAAASLALSDAGLEPASLAAKAPKSFAFANFSSRALFYTTLFRILHTLSTHH